MFKKSVKFALLYIGCFFIFNLFSHTPTGNILNLIFSKYSDKTSNQQSNIFGIICFDHALNLELGLWIYLKAGSKSRSALTYSLRSTMDGNGHLGGEPAANNLGPNIHLQVCRLSLRLRSTRLQCMQHTKNNTQKVLRHLR